MLEKRLNRERAFDGGAHLLQVSGSGRDYVGQHRISQQYHMVFEAADVASHEFAGIGLSRIRYRANTTTRFPRSKASYLLQIVTRGRCRWHYRGGPCLALSAGQALIKNPEDQLQLSCNTDCETISVNVPGELLRNGWLEQSGPLPRQGISFDRCVVDLHGGAGLLPFLDLLFNEVRHNGADAGNLQVSYREILVNKLLQQFGAKAREQDDGDTFDRGFAELICYIEENIKEELGVEELARLGQISIRTLYNYFSRHFSLTPRLYVKNAKMRSLRAELINNTCIRNVTEAALDYGFTHLGRFSSDYRKMFGELPSETLKRQR
ncbi:MAG: AraC family transcriptional regulator [Gammaproteobacteria bacterium]|nr:AraC family transcriptional regulator [Gammaproteobacteria bacterium]